MKYLRFFSIIILLGGIHQVSASVTINLFAGKLFLSDGTTLVPNGALIQLLASTNDNTFTAPTAASFTGLSSDDQVVSSFSMNSNGGTGSLSSALTLTLAGNFGTGDSLLLRWYPTLTTSSSSPGSGTSYGEFRTDVVENGSTTGWVTPSDGNTISLNFADTSAGGTEPNSAGTASLTVVPEPSTYTLLSLGLMIGSGVYLRRRNKCYFRLLRLRKVF